MSTYLQRQERIKPIPAEPVNKADATLVEDPRPELPDTLQWWALFRLALLRHGSRPDGVLRVLRATRFMGTQLQRNGGRWQFTPVIDPSGLTGWRSEESWQVERRESLGPYRQEIVNLLREVKG